MLSAAFQVASRLFAKYNAPRMSEISSDQAPKSSSELDSEAKVHAAGTFKPGSLRWGYFLVLNAIAGVLATAFFVAVFYADGIDPYMQGTYDWLLAHPGATSVMAFSPLACSLLVGWGYSQRARKRKAAAQRRAEANEAGKILSETNDVGAELA